MIDREIGKGKFAIMSQREKIGRMKEAVAKSIVNSFFYFLLCEHNYKIVMKNYGEKEAVSCKLQI
jgi:hypothetical protein